MTGKLLISSKARKSFLTMQSSIGNLLPNTSDMAPIKGQHKNWRRENSDPMKPRKKNKTMSLIDSNGSMKCSLKMKN